MAERSLHTDLKKRLINNEAFTYAHLIKFERPSQYPNAGGVTNTNAARYSYYTDAEVNISYDDGSSNSAGSGNGAQTYVADKILKVGSYSETTQAKATGMTLELAGETLNNSITSNAITMSNSNSTITVPSSIDLVNEGFREGDKISITSGSNDGN